MEWIETSKQSPEVGERVLVKMDGTRNPVIGTYQGNQSFIGRNDSGVEYWCCEGGVTHWLPIPPLPVVAEKGAGE